MAYQPSCSNVGGFLVYRRIQKVRNRIGDTSFNYTCKQPNQVGIIPLYIPALIGTGKVHEQSIYPKHPCPVIWGNQNPLQRKTSVGYIPKVLH